MTISVKWNRIPANIASDKLTVASFIVYCRVCGFGSNVLRLWTIEFSRHTNDERPKNCGCYWLLTTDKRLVA